MLLRSKPTTVEVEIWHPGKPIKGVIVYEEGQDLPGDMPAGIVHCLVNGVNKFNKQVGAVKTINGQWNLIYPGDYVFPEHDGIHYYPVKPEVVRKKYDVLEH